MGEWNFLFFNADWCHVSSSALTCYHGSFVASFSERGVEMSRPIVFAHTKRMVIASDVDRTRSWTDFDHLGRGPGILCEKDYLGPFPMLDF